MQSPVNLWIVLKLDNTLLSIELGVQGLKINRTSFQINRSSIDLPPVYLPFNYLLVNMYSDFLPNESIFY